MSDGDGIDFVPVVFGTTGFIGACKISFFEGLVNNWKDGLEMGTGGNFRNDTTVSFKNVDLGDNDIAENCRFSIS